MPKPILGHNDELFAALKAAGIADENTRRVVIDISVTNVVMVYVEKYADTRIIEVVTQLEGIEIKSITAPVCAECGHMIHYHLPRCTVGAGVQCLCNSYQVRT